MDHNCLWPGKDPKLEHLVEQHEREREEQFLNAMELEFDRSADAAKCAEAAWEAEMERQAAEADAAYDAWEAEQERIAQEANAAYDAWEAEQDQMAQEADAAYEAWVAEQEMKVEAAAAAYDAWEAEQERIAQEADAAEEAREAGDGWPEWQSHPDEPDEWEIETCDEEDYAAGALRALLSGDDETMMRWEIEHFEPPFQQAANPYPRRDE